MLVFRSIFLKFVFITGLFSSDTIWNNGPTKLLKDIFQVFGVQNINNLNQAINESNSLFRRQKNKERWETPKSIPDDKAKLLHEILLDSGLTKEISPLRKNYEAAVVFGASISRFKNRLEYLCRIIEDGCTFESIYILGSNRDLRMGPIDEQICANKLVQKGLNTTEIQMMIYVWDEIKSKNQFLKNIRVIFVNTPNKPDGTRSGTIENLNEMLKLSRDGFKNKYVLCISNNPYVPYQDSVAKKVLKPLGVFVETVGDAISADEKLENLLDAVALTLNNIVE